MRILWPALLLLPGCLVFDLNPNEPDDETGLFVVSIEGASPGPAFIGSSLAIHVEDSIFEADGPDRRESIQFLVDYEFDAYADDADIAFQLRQGDYENVFFGLSIRSDASHSVEFEAERDGLKYRLRVQGVDEIDLAFDVGRLDIDDSTVLGRVRFDPAAWITAVGASGAQQDVEIDGNSPEYAALVRAIEETTTFTLATGGAPTDDDDGSDDDTTDDTTDDDDSTETD